MRITENENGFSPSERQYLLYRYLEEHTNREKVATPAEIKKYLEEYGIKVSTNTLYNDLRILGTAETFNLQWEYDQKQKGYRVTNPTFEPREIRLLIDSVQASHFLTQAKAEALVKKIKTLTENPNHRISALLGRKKPRLPTKSGLLVREAGLEPARPE